MPGKHAFEYAVIRVVPQVEREEFINVGVIVYCRDLGFLETQIRFDEARLCAFPAELDAAEVSRYLEAVARICAGDDGAGPMARLDPASRFRWLTAKRSTVVQTSDIHVGLCDDPQQTLHQLYTDMVL